MNKTQRANFVKWMSALRSGTYSQGRGQLRIPVLDLDYNITGMTYCCLGVACDVVAPHRWNDATEFGPDRKTFLPSAQFMNEYFGIPLDQMPQSGNPLVVVNDTGGAVPVSTLNDLWGYSFPMIADLLEATYLKPEEEAAAEAPVSTEVRELVFA
ncbi:hypothetical protein [Saccharothrix sp. HUAS TT1]|uniref:hypothetical protein n=1 Tax=unclassified Saccharothrix TaxID=2593673 RepID=UPI00345B92C9